MVDLELIVSETKEVMGDCIRRIRDYNSILKPKTYGELISAIDEEIGNFDGYWKSVYNMVKEKLGDEKAKEFQKEIIIHHYNITGNDGYEGALKYSIGFDINWDDYKKIIEKIHLKSTPMGGAVGGAGAV